MLSLDDLLFLLIAVAAFVKVVQVPSRAEGLLMVHVVPVTSSTGKVDKCKKMRIAKRIASLTLLREENYRACDWQRDAWDLVMSWAVTVRLQRSLVSHRGQNWTFCRVSASCNGTAMGGDTAGFLFFRHSLTQTLELPRWDLHFLVCRFSTVCLG